MARSDRIEGSTPVGRSGSSGRGEIESFSKRSTELTKSENAKISAQSKAAKSYETKDLGASERGQAAAETRKANEMDRIEKAYKYGKQEMLKKAAVVGAGAAAAAEEVGRAIGKKQGTQANHTVTSVDRKTGKAK